MDWTIEDLRRAIKGNPDLAKTTATNPELAALIETPAVSASKYHNARTESKGMSFQSGHEAAGVSNLIIQEDMRAIFALRLQVRFPLPGDTVYVADAVYLDKFLEVHVVDFKGFLTKEYQLKKKLFRETYGQEIEEL